MTLVEMLVVVGIIGILVSILLPAISRVRDAANTTKCLSNLRQIGLAFNDYANDHNGCLVPGDYIGLIDGFPKPGAGNWADILVDGQYISAPTGTYSASADADFDAGISRQDTILRCPSGQDDANAADDNYPTSQTDPRGSFYFSRGSDITQTAVLVWYAVNCTPRVQGSQLSAQDLRPLPFNFLPDYGSGTANWGITRLARLRSSLPLVFDGVWCFNGDPARINARHGKQQYTNILFADCHAESQLASTLPNDDWYLQ